MPSGGSAEGAEEGTADVPEAVPPASAKAPAPAVEPPMGEAVGAEAEEAQQLKAAAAAQLAKKATAPMREAPSLKTVRVSMLDIDRGQQEPEELEEIDVNAPLIEFIAELEEQLGELEPWYRESLQRLRQQSSDDSCAH